MLSAATGSALCYLTKFGNDPRNIVLAKTASSLVTKGPLTLLDSKADSETKMNAAIWQSADSVISLGAQFAVFPLLPVVGKTIAKHVFNYKDPKAIEGVIKSSNFLGSAVLFSGILIPYLNSMYLTKGINTLSTFLTGKKLMPQQELDQQEKREKYAATVKNVATKQYRRVKGLAGKVFSQAFFINASQKLKNLVSPIANIVDDIHSDVNDINEKIASFLVTKKNVLSDKLFGFKIDDNDNNERKIANILLKTEELLLAGGFIVLGAKLVGPLVGKKLEHNFAKMASATSTTEEKLLQTTLIDGITKPVVALATGNPYIAVRKCLDKVFGAGALLATNPLMDKMASTIAAKTGPWTKEGIKSFLSLTLQNTLLVNVLTTLLVNEVSGRMFNKNKENAHEFLIGASTLKSEEETERTQLPGRSRAKQEAISYTSNSIENKLLSSVKTMDISVFDTFDMSKKISYQ